MALAVLFCALLPSAAESRREAPRREPPLEAALRLHVETLASDEFEGREPGTDGETKTLRYLAREWFDIGMESGTNDPGNAWFAPVVMVEREPLTSRAVFMRARKKLSAPDDGIFVVTSGIRSLIENAPLLFVGKGRASDASRTELAGRIALILDSDAGGDKAGGDKAGGDRAGGDKAGGDNAGGDKGPDRAGALLDAGASAVITVLDGERTLDDVVARRRRAGYALFGERLGGDIEGFMSVGVAAQLLAGGAAGDLASLRRAAQAPDFAPRLLGVTGTLEATSRETRIKTHNLIGKLEGRRSDAGAVMMVAHWDHFGKCAEPPAEHLICNGAVDNASGLAVITEVARILSRGKPLDRDVYFLATTGEELGLLGAQAFAENPPIPLDKVVAVFNVDSTGLVPAGQPVSVVGRGMTHLDEGIDRVLKSMKRKAVPGNAANAYMRRQDGWVFIQHDVPAVMVSTAYSDAEKLERFMEDRYHRPSDVSSKVEYGGMADDVILQAALVRHFADAKRVPALKDMRAGTP
ncbi:MAG: peptidase M28 [Novosphingobium sp. 12-63-9]|nr:MAG: peptidase M28 [Novosphingobium sp. 12-63-9]